MSKPATNEAGVPVRRGAYDYETRGGKLQDVNKDNQVSFADTWIGDMLGMDGQAGVQGPGMRDSMAGARRKAIEMMQAQGVPMTQANLARAMNAPGGGEAAPAAASAPAQPAGAPAGASVDEEGNPVGAVAAAAAAGGAAAGAYAAKRMLDGKPLKPDADGNVRVPVQGGRGGTALVPAAKADADGWAVVGINYPDGSNALPSPSKIDMIDGTAEDVTDVGRSAAGPATPAYADGDPRNAAPNTGNVGPGAGDAATRPISTEELMDNPNPVGTVGGDNTRFVDTGLMSHGGEPIFSDNVNGGYVTRRPDGTVVTNATLEGLRNAIRAAIR
jgi:hypothetical protein